MSQHISALSVRLDTLKPLLEKRVPITLHDLEKALGKNRVCFMILVLCLPFYLPVSIPGISTPFGLGIAWIALRELLGHKPHLPKILAKVHLSPHLLKKIIESMHHFDQKTRHWICPRWTFVSESLAISKVTAVVAILSGLILCLPLPIPFSNWIPAITILLTFMGRLYGDGAWILVGILLSLLMICTGIWMADTLKELFIKAMEIFRF